jgi:YD repeat-containing protein
VALKRSIMRIITIALLTTLATLAPAQAQDVRFHDAQGRVTGKARVDSSGATTFYDRSGFVTGRARTDSNGTTTTTFYDASGRVTGSTHAPAPR